MQKELIFRIIVIAAVIVVLMVPLMMIEGLVRERQGKQADVERVIAASSAGPQLVGGPLLVVPYVEHQINTSKDDKGREIHTPVDIDRQVLFVPDSVRIDAVADTEPRYKGLYKALMFRSRAKVTARFSIPVQWGLAVNPKDLTPGAAWLGWSISDPRGLSRTPTVTWNQREIDSLPGTGLDAMGAGVRTPVGPLEYRAARTYEVTATIELAGTRSLGWIPIGKQNQVSLASPWPHPNFGGRFLPKTRQIGGKGFAAQWEVSYLASRNTAMLLASPGRTERTPLESFEVSFIEPVNIYLLAERATKYGVLFIGLMFGGFFLFETLREWRIHPLQYGMVGLALAVFFLLLISLSEHLDFALAYGAGAAASTILIVYYLFHILRGWRPAAAFGTQLVLLFAVLYGLLQSEDNALLMGSLLVFAALAALMILTRRIDWYATGRRPDAAVGPER